jgi:uroporphyrinogen-III synthase
MKRILLTRSEEENKKIAKRIEGFEVLSCPMLFYKDLPIDWDEFKAYSNLIITSKYAAQLVSEHYPFEVDVYVVGEESAGILSANPRLKVVYVGKSAELLLSSLLGEHKVIDAATQKKMSELAGHKVWVASHSFAMTSNQTIYLSGNHITTEFEDIKRKEIYRVDYPDSLNPEIFEKPIDYVFIYSKNSCKNLIKLLEEHNLLQKIKNSVSIALSRALADQMRYYVSDVIYPDKPVAEDMINMFLEYERKKTE